MGVWENFKAKRQAKKEAEIDAEITRIETEKGKSLTQKGREKVTKNVETKRKKRGIRNAFIAILGSLGIAVAGNALLPSGNQPEVGDKTKIETETENKENTSTSKKEAYLKELQNMDLYDQTDISKEEVIDTNIIDQIVEKYKENSSEQETIDVGIIKQSTGTVGQIIEDTSGDEVTYIKAPKSVDELEEGQTHVDDQIKGGYYLVNDDDKETITGVIETADGYHEIRVDYVSIKDANGNETVYTRNPDTYVDLGNLFEEQLESGEISWDTMGESLSTYYVQRTDNIDKSNVSEINDDGFDR